MFYQLLFIHLYRPFLKYTKSTSPLPQHVSPRKLCSQAAAAISKLLRIYKKSYGLRQICNIAVYIAHSACTIHLLNLPERNAKRDLIHGVRNLEEIAEGWLCARRTLRILDLSAIKWNIEVPTEVMSVFDRTRNKWGSWGSWDQVTSPSVSDGSPPMATAAIPMPVAAGRKPDGVFPSASSSVHSQQSQQQQPPPPQPTAFIPNRQTTYATAPPIQHQMTTNANLTRAHYSDQMENVPFENYARPSTQSSLSTNMNRLHPNQNMTYARPDSGFQTHPHYQTQQPQQDMMNKTIQSHQDTSCDNSNSSNSPAAVTGTPPMPVFNGLTDNLMEENQDWWMRDQSALALGLENWGEGWAGNQFMTLNSPPDMQSTQLQHPHATANLQQQVPGNVQNGVKPGYGYANMPPSGY
jgi:hypothetical protein